VPEVETNKFIFRFSKKLVFVSRKNIAKTYEKKESFHGELRKSWISTNQDPALTFLSPKNEVFLSIIIYSSILCDPGQPGQERKQDSW
jgi:hypothetical protein